MLIHSSPMEIMRQFLAAFAGSNRDALERLLSEDAHLTISKKNTWFQSRNLPQNIDFLLAETSSWARRRIDVQSWSTENEALVTKFHVSVKRYGRIQEYAYTIALSINDAQIEALKICGETVATAIPVWQLPTNPNFQLAPR